jgi:hypothetical protein
MTNLARYLILAVISFLFSANFPVLAGTNITGLGNLARAQSVYWDNTPLSVFSYLIAAFLFVSSIGTLIYTFFFMDRKKEE